VPFQTRTECEEASCGTIILGKEDPCTLDPCNVENTKGNALEPLICIPDYSVQCISLPCAQYKCIAQSTMAPSGTKDREADYRERLGYLVEEK
jgi:hypothetical protein